MYRVMAMNLKDGNEFEIYNGFETDEEAVWYVLNDVSYTDDEDPFDWTFDIVFPNGERVNISEYEDDDEEDYAYDEEMGFNPYMGCYDFDC